MDEDEFNRLKSEAERQMNEIHAKSQPEPQESENKEPEQNLQPPAKEKESIIKSLLKDKDKTIILSLILLLMDEKEGKTDYSLLLALFYILLE